LDCSWFFQYWHHSIPSMTWSHGFPWWQAMLIHVDPLFVGIYARHCNDGFEPHKTSSTRPERASALPHYVCKHVAGKPSTLLPMHWNAQKCEPRLRCILFDFSMHCLLPLINDVNEAVVTHRKRGCSQLCHRTADSVPHLCRGATGVRTVKARIVKRQEACKPWILADTNLLWAPSWPCICIVPCCFNNSDACQNAEQGSCFHTSDEISDTLLTHLSLELV
jgi:hypothetical protein